MSKALVQAIKEDFELLITDYEKIKYLVNGKKKVKASSIDPIFYTEENIVSLCLNNFQNVPYLDAYMDNVDLFGQVMNWQLASRDLDHIKIEPNMKNLILKYVDFKKYPEGFIDFEIRRIPHIVFKDYLEIGNVIFSLIFNPSIDSEILLHLETQVNNHHLDPQYYNVKKIQKTIKNHKNYQSVASLVLSKLKQNQ